MSGTGLASRACVLALLLLSLTPALAVQQRPVFRSAVRTVAIYATVSDQEGRLVPNLERNAFRVLDNGRSADISVFSNELKQITAAIMLDMSGSMVGRVLRVRESADRFIDAINPGDRARIGTFGDEVAVSPLLTDDQRVLRRVLHEELWPGGGTPLWRALLVGMTSLEGESGRRVILVLTDGNDSDMFPSHPAPGDVKRRAVRDEFMVYAIGMERTAGGGASGGTVITSGGAISSGRIESGGLSQEIVDVVEETGGGHFELKSDADLGDTFARVAEELRHQYLLGFSPVSLDGRVHRLEVQVTLPGCKVRARKSYVAQGEG